jgi:hypothetical protein
MQDSDIGQFSITSSAGEALSKPSALAVVFGHGSPRSYGLVDERVGPRLASLRHYRGAGWRIKSRTHSYFGGNTAIASTSNKAPGRASCGTPIVVLAGGAAVFTYLSRTSR